MIKSSSLSMNLHFSPSIDLQYIWALTICGIILVTISVISYRRAMVFRLLTFIAFMVAILNPSILKSYREYIKDTAVIVVDKSYSQKFENREARTNQALSYVTEQIENMDEFDLRIIHAPEQKDTGNRTDLFTNLDQAINDIPKNQRAGVIFISDGQVHDLPQNKNRFNDYGPVHLLLSGKRSDKDRKITIIDAPAYGLVGKNIEIKYQIDDTKNIGKSYANVTLTMHDGSQKNFNSPIGQEQSITLPLAHPSQNIFSIEVDGVRDEITLANNKAAIIVNGVRDRLKVLLISGVPHAGERTWRDLLKSDPGVDLVHFTILREPQKYDYTPKNEMSLIAFPFRELFEVKLYDFDLIIFDRYSVNNILPKYYFKNIADYVRKGGAFLTSSGSEFASKRSIYNSALGDILPAKPTGNILDKAFIPKTTKIGGKHPVTKNLIWNGKENNWGEWLRAIDVTQNSGDALLSSIDDKPLLILDRVDQGRVAQLNSDHIWLWSRGHDGGGPHIELLRRTVHWLMKEPDLDELSMNISVHKNEITVRKQNIFNIEKEIISLTMPDSEQITIDLKDNEAGFLEYKLQADQLGIYAFEDSNLSRKFAIIGNINPLELSSVKTSADKFAPIVNASHGTTIWLEKTPKPKVIIAANNAKNYGGSNWLALKHNDNYNITGVKNIPLLPAWAILFALLSSLIFLWWREGKN